jgi:hypothetical protein
MTCRTVFAFKGGPAESAAIDHVSTQFISCFELANTAADEQLSKPIAIHLRLIFSCIRTATV